MTEKLQNKIYGAKSEEEVKTILVIISMPVGVKSYRLFDCKNWIRWQQAGIYR